MSNSIHKNPLISRTIEQLSVPAPDAQTALESADRQDRIPLTVRTRHRVLRVAPAVDDGFRPFRIF
jgi:hypothetical protein